MPTPEADVLKPVDPSITDSDDWEIFVLNDARVVYESNGKLASLLSAYADTPLRVEGRLEAPGRAQTKHLLKKPYKPTDIVISNVTRFSYGEMTDGDHVIWAQGAAGWFEIRPSTQYQAIYNDMVQAVELLYFITDIYSESRKRGGGPTARLVYQEYAEDERFACTDAAAAEAIFRRHQEFLIMCFLTRAQGIGWSNTPIYPAFRQLYPKTFESCMARLGRRFQIPAERQTKPTKAKSPTPAAKPTSSKSKTTTKSEEPPKKDNNWWEAATLFEFMQKAVNQRVLRAGRNRITLERVAQLLTRRYEIEEAETAQNVLLVHAQNLCYMMDHPRRQDIRFFVDEPIYQELARGHTLSALTQRRAEGVELRIRKRDTLNDAASDSSNTSDEDAAISTPVRRAPRHKHGRLSVLRPKSAQYSGKGKSIKSSESKTEMLLDSSNDTSDDDDDDDDEEEEADATSDEMALNRPIEALGNDTSNSTSPRHAKRKHDDAADASRTRRKRAASTSPPPSQTPSSDGEGDAETTTALPLAEKLSASDGGLAATLVSSPLPMYAANGPRDSWVCSVDGCSQRIYGCSKNTGRRLITEHIEDHSKGREKVVGVLWGERERLHLPVDNLLKRIREMSEATTPLFPGEGVGAAALPQPVQRPV